MTKIALIIPYFGKYPVWMPLFLETCRRNPNLTFFFYSDCEEIKGIDNIIFHSISWNDYCSFISEKLSAEFHPNRAYKLCDVRPFYGYLYEEELTGYDFWGFCDIDLMFGNTSKFLSDKFLSKYDVISTIGDRVAGPFSLLRNSERYRKIGFKIKGWKEKLENEKNVGLDEKWLSDTIILEDKICRGVYYKLIALISRKKAYHLHYKYLAPFFNTICLHRLRRLSFVQYDCTPEIGIHQMEFEYKNGSIYGKDGNELMYLHFLYFKKNHFEKGWVWTDDVDIYNSGKVDLSKTLYIDANGIHN